MKTTKLFGAGFWVCAMLCFFNARAAVLTHRYSFDGDASDSIGNANGTLQGQAFIANGALVLNGTNSSVGLPNDLFTNYNSISFEVWYADGAVSSPNGQLYNFSGALGGMNYCLYGEGAYFGLNSNVVVLPSPAVGGTNHMIWTQDSASQTARIYINGLLAAQSVGFTNTPMMIGPTTKNLIGAGATNVAASNFKGSILEFRIYQGALTPLDAAVLDAFGQDQPQLNPGTLQAVRVVIPSPTGPGAMFRASVFADFSSVTNVNISTTQPDLVLTSDNTNVIAFAPDQRLQTVGLGTANITATWQGFSNTVAVTVGVPQDVALIHRYGFNEQTNDWIVHDSVRGANGRLFGTDPYSSAFYGAFSGEGELIFQDRYGETFFGPGGCYAALPEGIVSSLSEVTVEAWVTCTVQTSPWERIFDFGNNTDISGSTEGVSYLFLTTCATTFATNDAARFAISTNEFVNETPRLDWTNILPLNVTSFVAVTYSPVRGITKFYVNGQPVSAGAATIPLSAIIDTNNWLGRSQYLTDPYFNGRYNEFRIYSGLLSDADVAADFAAGPDTVGVDYVLHYFSSSNAFMITWGPSVSNLVLKSSFVLGPGAVWNVVPNTPVLQNGRYSVAVPLTGEAAYFQLRSP